MIEEEVEFSFSASGWLFIYQLGVAKALKNCAKFTEGCEKGNVFCTGSSGGSLVSTCLLSGTDIDLLRDYYLNCVDDCHSNPKRNMFRMREYVKGAYLAVKDSRKENGENPNLSSTEYVLKGKLGVSVTTIPALKNHIISDFSTEDELLEAILASCTMTPLAGFPFRLNKPSCADLHNTFVVDGGLSNIQPSIFHNLPNKKSIQISAFSHWDCEIKPSQYVPVWWGLFPAKRDKMEKLYELGVYDAQNWLYENDFLLLKPDITKPPMLVDRNSTKIGTLKRKLSVMSGLGDLDEAIEMGNDEFESKLMDKFILVSQRHTLKAVTVAALYTEICYLSGFNLLKAMLSAIENKRRQTLSGSRHMASIRRWLPESLLGSPGDAMSTCKSHATNLFTISPREVWKAAVQEDRVEEPNSLDAIDIGHAVEKRLLEESFVYRFIQKFFNILLCFELFI
eukprot:snap_masked-scaffold_9-processed-gene-6.23-mRNA-1 protein AED:0.05 eAED:1.00 QI:0/0/0/1/1/1/2/0/451